MTTKLTLTIDDEVVSSAKKYAYIKGRSLSALVEHYLKSVSGPLRRGESLSPRILKMKGVIKLPEDFNYKTELGKALSEKIGK